MRDDLLLYYERELRFLRRMGAEFADKYPKIASRLQLEENKCEDPHVERLIESFAFLAARVHLKVDDQFPEITDALLHTLYPHYIRPVPSLSIVQFHLDPDQGKLTSGLKIPKPLFGCRLKGCIVFSCTMERFANQRNAWFRLVRWGFSVAGACFPPFGSMTESCSNGSVIGPEWNETRGCSACPFPLLRNS